MSKIRPATTRGPKNLLKTAVLSISEPHSHWRTSTHVHSNHNLPRHRPTHREPDYNQHPDNPTRTLRRQQAPHHDGRLSARCPARSGRSERRARGCHCGRQDRGVTPVGFRSVPIGGSGGRVFAVGRGGPIVVVGCAAIAVTTPLAPGTPPGRAPCDALPGVGEALAAYASR